MSKGKSVWTKDSRGQMKNYRIYDDGDVYEVEHKTFTTSTLKIGKGSSIENAIEIAKSHSGGWVVSIDDL